jgi:hypothetical protein
MIPDLSGVGFAKADDADATRDGREAQHMQPPTQPAHRDKSRLGVELALIALDGSNRPIEFGHQLERQAALANVLVILGWIKLDEHW